MFDLTPDPALRETLQMEYQRLSNRIEDQRTQIDHLQHLIDGLREGCAQDERLLDDLGAVLGLAAQLQIEAIHPRLRGHRLQEVAVDVLRRRRGDVEEIHYREWFALLREEGHQVGGKDPLATFLTQVNRAPAVTAVGRRSGRYRLAAP